ncbi:unnamed protein product [Adineta steineri]|uniref:oleoyl-[acyl-carrier-protein] hydrolase n=1 Tax=Adineta steineri TaxID=433720 RepID=A0A813WXS3_9BILA|nr:unnamed protein product [Adineta steineri]
MANSSNNDNRWFQILHPRPLAKYQVFIFPGAGSPGPYYKDWGENFPDYEFALLIYPGRGTRLAEKCITSVPDYITHMKRELLPSITKPCIFIGHSGGTMSSFALARNMIETGTKADLIKLLIAMARVPPHLEDPENFYIKTDKELIDILKQSADPKAKDLFNFKPFVDMQLSILRADAKAGNAILPSTPINIPIIVYGGDKEEKRTEEVLNRWSELTTKKELFRVRMFPGHHYFFSECQNQVLEALKEDFDSILNNSEVN